MLVVKKIGELVVVTSSSISENLFLKSDTGLMFIIIHLLFYHNIIIILKKYIYENLPYSPVLDIAILFLPF